MFDRAFLTSKLGVSALVSLAAMSFFNVWALSLQLAEPGLPAVALTQVVELA